MEQECPTGAPPTTAGPPDFYQLLHVDLDAPPEAIAEAYWRLAEELRKSGHQRLGRRAQFAVLNEAYATLVTPARRKAHDAGLPHVKALRQERARMLERARRRSHRPLMVDRHASLGAAGQSADAVVYAGSSGDPAGSSGASSMLQDSRGNGPMLAAREPEAHTALDDPAHRAAYDALLSRPRETEARSPPEQAVSSSVPGAALAQRPLAAAWARSSGRLMWRGLRATGRFSRRFARRAWPIVVRCSRWFALRTWRVTKALARLAWGAMKGAIAEYKQRQRPPPDLNDAEVRSRLSSGLAPQHGGTLVQEDTLADLPPQQAGLLIVEGGPQAGEVLEILDEPVTLGADDGCALRLGDDEGGVAGEHARIWRRQGRFIIRQLGGHPCILVGGCPIPWAVLEDGDRIEIGEHVLRFQLLGPRPESLQADGG